MHLLSNEVAVPDQAAPQLARMNADLRRVLDLSCGATVLCDARGHVLTLTRDARAILERADGLKLGAGRLLASEASAAISLQDAIASLSRPCARATEPRHRLVRVRREGGSPDYELLLFAIDDPATRDGRECDRVVIFVHDPESRRVPSPELLARAYHLTRRESEILCLVASGSSPHEIARKLRIGRETVKSHLGALYGKTGSRHRSHLVSTVLRGFGRFALLFPGPAPDAPDPLARGTGTARRRASQLNAAP